MDADEIALLMADHRLTTPVQCSCGFRETDAHAGTWKAHLAAVLAPLVEQAKREGAVEAWEEGLRFGQLHWATNYAGVYENGSVKRQAPNPYRAERAAQTPRDGGGS